MTESEINFPAGWTITHDGSQPSTAIVKYQYEPADETTFIVSVLSRTTEDKVELRLSTINPTSTHVRHDYPVQEYKTREAAVKGAESFIEMFSQRVREGSISSANPEIDVIRETIQTFRENRVFPSISRVLRRLR